MRPVQIGQCHATIHATRFLHFDTPSTLAEHNMITCKDEIRRRKRKMSRDAISGAKIKVYNIPMLNYFPLFFSLEKKNIFSIVYTVNLLRLEMYDKADNGRYYRENIS